MSPAPSLVVLAAGLGTRFGGWKQLEPLGPGGATLMDYSAYDAWRAGFSRIVFVLHPDIAGRVSASLAGRYRGRLEVATAIQRLDDLPAGASISTGRARPWGTAHAVLAARREIPGPFVVLNADDFYGREALAALADFLTRSAAEPDRHAVAAYRLDATASPAGPVNRAIVEVGPGGRLARIGETIGLTGQPAAGYRGAASERTWPADTLVSMNLWAFKPSVLPVLERGFERFLAGRPGAEEEYLLPTAVQDAIDGGLATVDVLPVSGRWLGVTYREDRERVRSALSALVAGGHYPEILWPPAAG